MQSDDEYEVAYSRPLIASLDDSSNGSLDLKALRFFILSYLRFAHPSEPQPILVRPRVEKGTVRHISS
jgi:hypothetical protein